MAKEIRDPELSLHITAYEMIERLVPTNAKVFHPANGGLRDKRTAELLKLMGVVPGVADFVVMLENARVGCIEMKTSTGRLSADQVRFREICALLKTPYHVSRSVEDVINSLSGLGVKFENSYDFKTDVMTLGRAS